MPTYDFRCTACDHRFEVTRPMGSTAEEACPECGAPTKKVFAPVGVSFKGTGFHNTDYKSTSPRESATAPSCPSASEGGGCAGCPAASGE
ncbi:MAG TPA: FmdB family zinc ribbon protein [Coriobacteriia bacterium]|nr:FmdB family zinc ribbon protein [Coriobacteriia bacterium]